MTLQKIKSLSGKDEYVLLPVAVYRALRGQIENTLRGRKASEGEYTPFVLEDYVDNPVALARINADITQAELARRMGVSQAYVAKVEGQARVSGKVLAKVQGALRADGTHRSKRSA
jgi:ribosome-binding protein aMBF1 (putative translation factor)